jgi:hypothetical protein
MAESCGVEDSVLHYLDEVVSTESQDSFLSASEKDPVRITILAI